MATTANEVAKLCPCGKKISAWDTHPVCAACLGLSHAQAALTPAHDCIHCAAVPRKLLRRRLARRANLSGGDPLLCEAAAVQGETEMPGDLAATPGPSWAEADPQPIATAFPSLEAHGDRVFFRDAGVTWGGDANEDGDESADSELLLSDDGEEEDSTSLASISWAAKPSATGEVEKPTPPSPLDLDMQDMCKRAAARLNIPWPAIQTEVVKSRIDGMK
ncbi:uncharacterized protein LOC121812307 [Haplochromis burtoni]|uniref:uncharacterized protein LOC121812307 n=1 Tax=Haplochromis burtoni TaxID=8153 RepID=UPI001C2D0419|nr:uncharacterized protein LOC121812307 [Haplochromis burtoni]